MSRKIVEQLVSGTMLDRIQAYYRYGEEKVPLSEEDEAHLIILEHIRDLWKLDNDEVQTKSKIVSQYGISERQAHNWLQDAKLVWALSQKFNYTFELALQKERIEKAFTMAIASSDAKMMKAALDSNFEWMELSRKDAERNAPQSDKNLTIIFHMDFSQFMSSEQMERAKSRLEEIKILAHKRFKNIEDAEYTAVSS